MAVGRELAGRPGAERTRALAERVTLPAGVRYAAPPMRFSALILLVLSAGLGLASCGTGGACQEGDRCECSEGDECFLGCDGDNCDQSCHHTGSRCGAVCEHGCSFTCHDTNECSAYCGDGCDIECHHTAACGAICEGGCRYECHDTSRCGVIVGPGSVVTCRSVATCAVECQGSCRVFCNEGVDSCSVTCPDDSPAITCPDGELACGEC